MPIVPRNELVREHFNKAEGAISCKGGGERRIHYQIQCKRRQWEIAINEIRTVEEEMRKENRKVRVIAGIVSNLPSK